MEITSILSPTPHWFLVPLGSGIGAVVVVSRVSLGESALQVNYFSPGRIGVQRAVAQGEFVS